MAAELKGTVSRRGFLAVTASVVLAGCAGSRSEEAPASSSDADDAPVTSEDETTSADAVNEEDVSKAIVCCFSHAGENYGVGFVEEGNTEVVAQMIAEQTGADLFMIEPVEAYPEGYDDCCDVALEEQKEGARPQVAGVPDGWDGYGTVYLGYPIWWGDMPQCLYTFVEQLAWDGKDVRPFNTHAGSGAANVPATLRSLCSGATVGEALAISGVTAQNSRDEAREQVEAWLA